MLYLKAEGLTKIMERCAKILWIYKESIYPQQNIPLFVDPSWIQIGSKKWTCQITFTIESNFYPNWTSTFGCMSQIGYKLYPTVAHPTFWILFGSNLDTNIADFFFFFSVFALD